VPELPHLSGTINETAFRNRRWLGPGKNDSNDFDIEIKDGTAGSD
jgi:hypothetical protein